MPIAARQLPSAGALALPPGPVDTADPVGSEPPAGFILSGTGSIGAIIAPLPPLAQAVLREALQQLPAKFGVQGQRVLDEIIANGVEIAPHESDSPHTSMRVNGVTGRLIIPYDRIGRVAADSGAPSPAQVAKAMHVHLIREPHDRVVEPEVALERARALLADTPAGRQVLDRLGDRAIVLRTTAPVMASGDAADLRDLALLHNSELRDIVQIAGDSSTNIVAASLVAAVARADAGDDPAEALDHYRDMLTEVGLRPTNAELLTTARSELGSTPTGKMLIDALDEDGVTIEVVDGSSALNVPRILQPGRAGATYNPFSRHIRITRYALETRGTEALAHEAAHHVDLRENSVWSYAGSTLAAGVAGAVKGVFRLENPFSAAVDDGHRAAVQAEVVAHRLSDAFNGEYSGKRYLVDGYGNALSDEAVVDLLVGVEDSPYGLALGPRAGIDAALTAGTAAGIATIISAISLLRGRPARVLHTMRNASAVGAALTVHDLGSNWLGARSAAADTSSR